jgi:tRNA threonylcarbamoyladenosine biosynthesis protein TsaB
MIVLFIDTTKDHLIEITVRDNLKIIAREKISAPHAQAEKLLPLIDSILKKNNLSFKDIKKIKVSNNGGSFTGLRIGVVTANALGYALGVPVESYIKNQKSKIKNIKFNMVKPIYNGEPNITKSKK